MSVLLVIHHESHVGDLVFHLELFFFMSQILSWNRKTKVYEKHEGYLSLPKIFRSLLCPYYSLGFLCVFFFSICDIFMLMTHLFLYFYINRFCFLEAMNYAPCLNFPKSPWFSSSFSLQLMGWLSLRQHSKALTLITKCIYAWVHTHRVAFKKK